MEPKVHTQKGAWMGKGCLGIMWPWHARWVLLVAWRSPVSSHSIGCAMMQRVFESQESALIQLYFLIISSMALGQLFID